jgi:hypothetical protein
MFIPSEGCSNWAPSWKRRAVLSDSELVRILILDCEASQNGRNKILLFINYTDSGIFFNSSTNGLRQCLINILK